MILSRRELLRTAGAAPFVARAAAGRLNVLMIAVDDLNNRLGCYGDQVVKSPNIDRLAARGARFDSGYCNFPLCSPSRTSLLSGRRPETTRVFDNTTPPRTHLGNVVMLPEHFRANGYFTGRVGKIAHSRFENAVSWDVSESATGGRPGTDTLIREATNNSDGEEPDGRTARRIVQLMEEKRDKPFFLGCGFSKPHLPFVAPKKYFDLYPPERIELPRTPANDWDDIPQIALTREPGDAAMSELERKTAVAGYHAATSFMDAQVGFVLGAVDRMKLWDNTIVLLFGDHGWHLNEHLGLWRKETLFEESARAPLVVAAPGHKKGISTKRLVEWVDLYPSLCDLAGLAKPEGLEGTSFMPLLDNPSRTWKKAAFTVVSRGSDPYEPSRGEEQRILGRSVRTERYRYTEWGSSDVTELYDHSNDPKEFTNLARNPKHAATLKQMRKVLRDGWKAALPG